MAHGTFNVPYPINEPVLSYAPGTPERKALQAAYQTMYNQPPIEVPMYLGAARVTTDDKRTMTPPHEHGKVLGHFSYGTCTKSSPSTISIVHVSRKTKLIKRH
mgnify:CR=1 FL=1